MIGEFTEITVSDSDNDLHMVRGTNARLMGRCLTFRKWRFGGRCYFGCSFLFSSLYFFKSLDLGPVQMAAARVLPPPETSQVEVEFPSAPDPPNDYHMVLIGCGTYGFVPLPTLNGCLIVSFYSYTGLCSPGGLHLKRGIM